MLTFNGDFNSSDGKLVLEICSLSYVVHSPTPSYTWSVIAACIVNIVFAAVGTILNSLVLYIFWKSTKMRSKLSYFAIMLLSSTDLAVVTIVHPTFLLQAINEINGTPKCIYKISYMVSLYFFTGLSISTLLVMNFERYTAIVHPIWHRTKATKPQLMFIWAILFLVIVLNVVSFFLYRPLSAIITIIIISSVCFASLFTYVSIFCVARKRNGTAARNTVDHETNCGNHQGEASGNNNMAAFLRELKMAKTYFIIVVLAFVCFIPAGIALHGLKYPWYGSDNKRSAKASAYTWGKTLASMNSTLNCLIFFWANKMLRREGLTLVKNISSTAKTS